MSKKTSQMHNEEHEKSLTLKKYYWGYFKSIKNWFFYVIFLKTNWAPLENKIIQYQK